MTIQDPNGLMTVHHFELDGTWSTIDPLTSDSGSLGNKFIADPENLLLTIDSNEFRNPIANDYYGDYEIQVQGGVGVGSPAAYFDPEMISCTFSLVCIVDSFEAGEQEFKSAEVELGKDLVFNFFNYTQSPANCDYDIDYTVTLIERNSTKD